MSNHITIQTFNAADIPEVLIFVLRARAELFPKLSATGIADGSGAILKRTYIHGDGQFLIARAEGQIVGAIGYLPYDSRFPQLNYQGRKTVEVVRLFVLPAFRRFGFGG